MNDIFRKKSMDRVPSPEQLNDYIRVTNPSVWVVLTAVVLLLVGICVWGVFGRLDTTVTAVSVCRDGELTCYVPSDAMEKVQEGLEIDVAGKVFHVSSVDRTPVRAQEAMSDYLNYLGEFDGDDFVCAVRAEADLQNGEYPAKIVVERVSPIFFVMN